MHSIRDILSMSLLLTLFSSFVQAHRLHQSPQNQEEESGFAGLQKLLDQVDAPSLHAALHDLSPKKFKHGMFQDDRTAVEAIHKDEPSLATSVVNIAKRNVMEDIKKDLAKRAQEISNGTTTTTTPAASVPESSHTGLATPVPQGGGLSSSTTSSPSTDTSTTLAGAGSSMPSTITSTSTSSNGAIVAGSDSHSTTSASTSAGESPSTTATSSASLTHGEVITSTNSVGLTIVSTVGGGVHTISPSPGSSTPSSSMTQSSITSTVVHTSTLPNGSQSVVTAVTIVGAGAAAADTPTGTAGVATAGSSSGSPRLQTGEAPMMRGWCKEMVLVVGGAVGVAMMM
ncbi:hypothetical protein HO173_001140 [Letharia columbiana]|uniref:GPI anchored protein n=1 Tax=Letharia columbiana TaxID=112416 RepID=A0A8H6L977_9LECA|nr:uncharacterized protein HO173_001140 [Letharia columbiana]KAF6240472.1 hypothetical protein HO173_001140 [Letharia columbiana]